MVAGGWLLGEPGVGGGLGMVRMGVLVFNGHRVSVWEGEKVLEMDGGDSCRAM